MNNLLKNVKHYYLNKEVQYYGLLISFLVYTQITLHAWSDSIIPFVNVVIDICYVVFTVFFIPYVIRFVQPFKKNYKVIVLVIVALIISACVYRATGQKLIFFFFLIAILSYKQDFTRIAKTLLVIKLIDLFISIIGVYCHFTLDFLKGGIGHSMGYFYANTFGLEVMTIVLLIWYLYLKNRNVLAVIFILAVSIPMYILSYCLTGFIVEVLLVLFVVAKMLWSFFRSRFESLRETSFSDILRTNKLLRFTVIAAPFVFCLISIICSVYYQSIFTGNVFPIKHTFFIRFSIGQTVISETGFSLFGKRAGIAVDNFYLYVLIEFGVIVGTAIMVWMSLVIKKCIDYRNTSLLIISLLFLFVGLMEANAFFINENFTLLYVLAADSILLNDSQSIA